MIPFIPLSIIATLDDGDRLFMESLYDKFSRLMFKKAREYFQDQYDVEDVVQQACIKLIKYLPTIKKLKRNALPVYIVYVIRSCSMDIYRKQKTERSIFFSDMHEDFEETIVDDFDLEEQANLAMSTDKLAQAILELPERDQFVLNAKYLMGWSFAEIAETLGVQEVSVRTRLFRAKRKALQILRGGLHEE